MNKELLNIVGWVIAFSPYFLLLHAVWSSRYYRKNWIKEGLELLPVAITLNIILVIVGLLIK